MSEILKSQLACGDAVSLTDTDSKTIKLSAPVSGQLIAMPDIADPSFSKEQFIDCVGIHTKDNVICSPCDGRIVAIASAKNGLGILNDEYGEILIQAGINTRRLDGAGFLPLVCIDDFVEKGDALLQIDHEVLLQNGFEPIVLLGKLDE